MTKTTNTTKTAKAEAAEQGTPQPTAKQPRVAVKMAKVLVRAQMQGGTLIAGVWFKWPNPSVVLTTLGTADRHNVIETTVPLQMAEAAADDAVGSAMIIVGKTRQMFMHDITTPDGRSREDRAERSRRIGLNHGIHSDWYSGLAYKSRRITTKQWKALRK